MLHLSGSNGRHTCSHCNSQTLYQRIVHADKEQGRPYMITFVGEIGVGKSTYLAKIAYWLQQHNISVVMAACDTFWSAAVELLQTHARGSRRLSSTSSNLFYEQAFDNCVQQG
ncbi:hypothetical protein MKW94_002114 [Papaver nudicaule]|uniref:SRP54-type proteins GTP-binding domain-containing protein n=1 Tax=Papaver nudicaule TaxID=74823 RepID=A0AA41VHS3_PAPNU|nr:hypothetical protein [Papaver nudicaule]